jgi:hypothetical protein
LAIFFASKKGVPKVLKVPKGGFWHFWHLHTGGTSKKMSFFGEGRGAKILAETGLIIPDNGNYLEFLFREGRQTAACRSGQP